MIESFEAWMRANFDTAEIADIVKYGADAGWPGLTYYTETHLLYARFSDDIWAALCEDADSLGFANPMELIASFRLAESVTDQDTLANLLVWYMAERVAREIAEG